MRCQLWLTLALLGVNLRAFASMSLVPYKPTPSRAGKLDAGQIVSVPFQNAAYRNVQVLSVGETSAIVGYHNGSAVVSFPADHSLLQPKLEAAAQLSAGQSVNVVLAKEFALGVVADLDFRSGTAMINHVFDNSLLTPIPIEDLRSPRAIVLGQGMDKAIANDSFSAQLKDGRHIEGQFLGQAAPSMIRVRARLSKSVELPVDQIVPRSWENLGPVIGNSPIVLFGQRRPRRRSQSRLERPLLGMDIAAPTTDGGFRRATILGIDQDSILIGYKHDDGMPAYERIARSLIQPISGISLGKLLPGSEIYGAHQGSKNFEYGRVRKIDSQAGRVIIETHTRPKHIGTFDIENVAW